MLLEHTSHDTSTLLKALLKKLKYFDGQMDPLTTVARRRTRGESQQRLVHVVTVVEDVIHGNPDPVVFVKANFLPQTS